MLKLFNNLQLRNKFLVLYIFAVFLPITLTNIIFYNVTTSNVKEQKMNDTQLVFQQMRADFLGLIEFPIGVTATLYTDLHMNEFFEKEYSSLAEYVGNYDQQLRGLNKYGPSFLSLRDIEYYTDNPTVIYAGGVRLLSEDVKESDWYTELESNKGQSPIVMRSQDRPSGDLSVIRELNYFPNLQKWKKIIKINLEKSTIEHIFKNASFPGEIYLINDYGEIEYSTDYSIDWEHEKLAFDSLSLDKKAILFTENYEVNYLNNWKLIGVVHEKQMLKDVRKSGLFIFYLAIFNFIIPTIIIVLITNSVYARIMKLVSHMKKLKNQDFQMIDKESENDEIGLLMNEYNRMTRKIHQLINDVYRVNLQKKDLQLQKQQAQLSALQSQINPHFLFNTLETIRMRSLIKNEEETATIIQNMAKMLRNSITWGKDWVTIEEEVNIIQSFLEIQQYRFDEKLSYEVNIEPTIKFASIPNISILPFVENASIHGIEPKKGHGHIQIEISKTEENKLLIEIIDDGVGFKESELESMLFSLKEEEEMGDRVGIKNAFYRLNMHYDEAFEFYIDSEKDKGTKITIIVPIK